MTASNHAVTGALMAIVIPNPVAAITAAFLAHFLMDAIPHFGLKEPDIITKNKNSTFLLILLIDLTIAGLLLISLPFAINDGVSSWTIFLAMFACMSPDLVWGWRFWGEVKHGVHRKMSQFSKFHKKIQWKEFPRGIFIEIAWFLVVFNLIFVPL